jgi:hypothetical protein
MADNDLTKLHGTPEEIEAFLRWKRENVAELNRKIAAGEIGRGDDPPILTAEDEEILDRVWAEPLTVVTRLPE